MTRATFAFLIPFTVFAILLLPISGRRHLWQDEVETAERARSITSNGVPEIIDPEGRVSVNAAGWEIEEGRLHRYSPWGQFYIGAAGLTVGRLFHLNDDASVRSGFVILHGAAAGLVALLVFESCGWPLIISTMLGLLFGAQTVLLLYDRTARYQSPLVFLFVLGLYALATRLFRPRTAFALLAVSVFLLPQMHTLGGCLLSSTLVLLALVTERSKRSIFFAALPAFISLCLLVILTRPWLQTVWTSHSGPRFSSSLKSSVEIAYGFYVFAAGMLLLFVLRKWKPLAQAILVGSYMVATVLLLDFYPFSQTRYYLALPVFFVFWFTVLYPQRSRALIVLTFIGVLLPEVQGVNRAWQGLRIAVADYRMFEPQPLREALSMIPSHDAVLVDYVPQFVNWYLRSNPVALMPDPGHRTALNLKNEVWKRELLFPDWQVRFKSQNGPWTCSPNCDFSTTEIVQGRYTLTSDPLKHSEEMCVVRQWATDTWNNAPFVEYNAEAEKPEGPQSDTLILARRCSQITLDDGKGGL